MVKGPFLLFLCLAIGYILCVLAKKQEGLLKTVGYTLGISIIVMSLFYGVIETNRRMALSMVREQIMEHKVHRQ